MLIVLRGLKIVFPNFSSSRSEFGSNLRLLVSPVVPNDVTVNTGGIYFRIKGIRQKPNKYNFSFVEDHFEDLLALILSF